MPNSRPTNDAAALQGDVNNLQKIVHSIIDVALDIGDREFGCERCSTCTIKMSELLTEWLNQKPSNCEEMFKKLEQFLLFPRAMIKILEGCIYCADQKKAWINSLAIQLNLICKNVIEKYVKNIERLKSKNTLNLSRLAAVIEIFKERLKEVLNRHNRWGNVISSIENLESEVGKLENFLLSENALPLFNEDKILRDGNIIKRPKRVCGGGILEVYIGERKPENKRKVYVVNFSRDHILVFVKEHFTIGEVYSGNFQPCQRELPFVVDIAAIERKSPGRTEEYIQIDSKMLSFFIKRDCDVKKYQVFEIKKISRPYYYLSLCVCLTPSNRLYRKSEIFLDRHNIPINIPIKAYSPSLTKLKSIKKYKVV